MLDGRYGIVKFTSPDADLYDTSITQIYTTALWQGQFRPVFMHDLNRGTISIFDTTLNEFVIDLSYITTSTINNEIVRTTRNFRAQIRKPTTSQLISSTEPFAITNLEAKPRGFVVTAREWTDLGQAALNTFGDGTSIHCIVTHNGGDLTGAIVRATIRPLGQSRSFTTPRLSALTLPDLRVQGNVYDTDKLFYKFVYRGDVPVDSTTQYEVTLNYLRGGVPFASETVTASPPGAPDASTIITASTSSVEATEVSIVISVEERGDGSVYWRSGIAGTLPSDSGTIFIPTGSRGSSLTINELTPNRRYFIEFSQDPEFGTVSRLFFDTPNLRIGGVRDPSLDFDQTNLFWRSVLRLPNFTLNTGKLPAGYIQIQHVNLTGVPRSIGGITNIDGGIVRTELVDNNPMSSVRDLGRSMAQRCIASPFELCDGRWELVSRTVWPSRSNLGTFLLSDYNISENTRRSEIREELAYSRVDAQVHSGLARNPDGSTSQTDTTVIFRPIAEDRTKLILDIDRTLDLTNLFTFLPEVPNWSRENIALVSQQTPLIVTVDIQDINEDPTRAEQLQTVEPSFNITVELPYQGHETALYTGMLMRRRVIYNESGTRPPIHQLTIWVDRITVQGLDILNWSTGEGWSTGRVWGAA